MDSVNQDPTEDAPAIAELLERRTQLQGWLDRLGEVGDDAEARVVQRVRTDYEERLAAVLEEIAGHESTLNRELDALRERLSHAGERFEAARDELDEMRLRHRIGEVGEEEWKAREPALKSKLEETARAREEAAAELARLEEILDQIGGETPPARSAAPATEPPPAPTEAPAIPREKDFLEELDRVIASTEPAEEEEPDTRPPPGVKCPDCGYMNDANAWYCGVCGVDLA